MIFEDRLSQLSVGANKEKVYSKWNIIKDETENKLKTVCSYFPHFSKHDSSHSYKIATYIGNLLGEDRINRLSYSDILIMLICFYKHDIGMALEYEEIYEFFHKPVFNNILNEYINDKTSDLHDVAKRLQKFGGFIKENDYECSIDVYNDVILIVEDIYRSNHAKRSADAIMNDSFLEATIHSRCQRIVADICEVHQKSINDILKLPNKENGLFGDYFHPRFIAAMLCLGDLLDLDTDRFDEAMIKASSPFPHLSKLHLEKHKSVRHFLVDKNTIEICADTDNIEVYRIFRKWLDWIQETCDYLALHWSEISPSDFGNSPRITRCDLLLNGNTKWLTFANTRYEVSDKRMFELLRGSKIYKNKFVCIREVIQNAVDATLLRLFNEEKLYGDDDSVLKQCKDLNWDDYKINVNIKIIDDTHVHVTVCDTGIGVSTEDVKKIAKVSNVVSTLRSELISRMPIWLRPAGAFGMGLQSIFLLTDQFEMITKTADELAKKITFQSAENSDGYIIVEDYNKCFKQGTKISFNIDGEKLSATELHCSNYHYKRKKISGFVISEIYRNYDNQRTYIPALRSMFKKTDYIPVQIEFETLMSDTKYITTYKPFFESKELDNIKVECGYIRIKKFIQELNCHIIGRICLSNKNSNGEPHTYGDIENVKTRYYNNTLFYRNNFVYDDIFRSMYDCIPIISYFDWCINLLDESSDTVLQISRNSINENYTGKFCKTLIKAFDIVSKNIIDNLIDNEYADIGDVVLIIYQFAVQLDY